MTCVLVSACLLGTACRYDGKEKGNPQVRKLLEREDLVLIPVCPEQLGGLPTPRLPSERKEGWVENSQGTDVTAEYRRGAKEALKLARLYERARYARTKVPGAREPYKEPARTGANIAEPGAGDMDAGRTDGALGAEDVKRAEACRDVLLGRRRR